MCWCWWRDPLVGDEADCDIPNATQTHTDGSDGDGEYLLIC